MSKIRFGLIMVLELMVLAKINAQSPQADFVVQSSACVNERVEIINTSTNGDAFEWDFCLGDFQNLISNTEPSAITGLSGGFGYRLVEDNGQWFGFAVSQGGSKIFRLDFGDSPTNIPSVTDLGTLGGLLAFPHEIELFNDDGTWYGFVTSNEVDFGLVRLNFGNSLTNIPSAVNVGNFGVSGRIWDIKIVRQSLDLVLVIAERNGGTIARVNFRDSFENPINPGIHVFNSIVITGGGNTAPGFDVVNTGSDWIVLLASHFDNKIYQVSFGSDIFSPATITTSYSFTGVSRPYRIIIVSEGEDYYAAISNDPSQPTSDPIQLVNFNDLNPVNTPVVVPHTGLPELIGIDAIRFKGKSIIQGVGIDNNLLKQVQFESICGASIGYSAFENPEMITYSTAGNYAIGLIAYANGELSSKAIDIIVSPLTAPDITFDSQDPWCAGFDIAFTSQNTSGDIIDYNWDFGDTNTSMQPNPTHQYGAAADYPVSLQVTASNGCNNLARDTITIYNAPVSNFSLPATSPICTNQEYLFTNTSTFDPGSNPTWQWEVNTTPVSTEQDLAYAITSSVQQDIKLIVSIPGCSNEVTQSILTVEEGPQANFTFSNGCQDASIAFTNTTIGTVTDYAWDFGDGNMSTQTNASNTYTTFGAFDVTLQATNAAGCANTSIQGITIYSKPQPDFSIDLPPFSCRGTASQFNDLTPSPPDSNLDAWTWSFGDPQNGTSVLRNPQYTYLLAGDYNVTLDVTTNFGCISSIQKMVTIFESPISDFTYDPACVNQGTAFMPVASTGVNSWQWKIGTATYNQQSPTHVFSSSSNYIAELTTIHNNGCVSVTTKLVTVPVPSSPDFNSVNNCALQNTLFTDLTPSGSDPVVSRAWQFGTLGTGTGATASYSFPSPGPYPTKLTITNASGCSYSISKNVNIFSSPAPTFTASPQVGTAPLTVQLANTTSNTISQLWSTNDPGNSTSSASTTQFTFNELGQYVVDLTVTNGEGCAATSSKIISVIVPSLDLELTSLTSNPSSSGEINLLVAVKNNSNSPITNPKAAIDISGQVLINEILNVVIQPDQTHTQVLTTGIAEAKGGLAYVCVELILDGDFNISNNKLCLSQVNRAVVLDPYPNPGSEQMTIEWIAENSGKADIFIFDPIGRKVFDHSIGNFASGLNRITVPLANYNPGIYHILFVSEGVRKSFRYLVRR